MTYRKSPRVLIIAPTYYVLGGVAVWASYLTKGLEEHGFDVTFGALEGRFHDAKQYLEVYPFTKSILIDCDVGNKYSRLEAIRNAIFSVRPDIVLVVNVADVYDAVRLIRKEKGHDFQLVSTLHGVVASLFSDMDLYKDVIDHVVVTNRLTEKMLYRVTDYQNSQVHYAQYGVPVEKPEWCNSKQEEPCTILYCGRIDDDQKRCQDLPILCKKLIDLKFEFKLLIVGDGPTKDKLLSELDSLGKDSSNKTIFEYVSSIPVERMNEVAYSRADVLILPSLWETGPIVAWEAMSQNVPLVTSRYIGSKSEGSLVHNTNCLMFDIGDMESAASAVIESQRPEIKTKLIAEGRSLVTQRYSRESSIHAWVNVLRRIYSSPRSKPSLNSVDLDDGRLEKIVGHRFGTFLRKVLRRRVYADSAGDEWPHAHSQITPRDYEAFDSILKDLENATSS